MQNPPDPAEMADFHKTLTEDQFKRSIPARLRTAGYQTAFFGKWGIGDSAERTELGARVFDYWAGQPKQTNFFHDADCRYVGSDGFARPVDNLCDCPADARGKAGIEVRIGKANLIDPQHVDSEITPAHVRRFLEGRDKAKPFFMALHFKSPHAPWPDWDPAVEPVTDGKTMPIPPAATPANAAKEPEVIKKSLGWSHGQTLLKSPERHARSLRDYYRSISSMNLGIGRILKELEDRDLAANTVILFTSDNGHFSGEHGLGGKWLMYEPSLRVPGLRTIRINCAISQPVPNRPPSSRPSGQDATPCMRPPDRFPLINDLQPMKTTAFLTLCSLAVSLASPPDSPSAPPICHTEPTLPRPLS